MRKLVVAALALAVLVPATALAGGWATVKLSSTPTGSRAGEPWVVQLTVLQHGQTPLADLQPHVRIEQGALARQFLARPTREDRCLPRSRRLPARGHVALVDLGRLLAHAHLQGRSHRPCRLSLSPRGSGVPPSGRTRLRRGLRP